MMCSKDYGQNNNTMTRHRTQTTNVRLKVKCAIHLTVAAFIQSDLDYPDLDYPDLPLWSRFFFFMNINKTVGKTSLKSDMAKGTSAFKGRNFLQQKKLLIPSTKATQSG